MTSEVTRPDHLRYCTLCSRPAKDSYFVVQQTIWHTECFKCAQCFCDLANETHYHVDGRNYCAHDFLVNFAPYCHKCEEIVDIGVVVRAATGTYHKKCFICDDCGDSLHDESYIVEGRLLCLECRSKIPSIPQYRCKKCGGVIDSSELLRYHNDFYHAYHFDCSKCGATLTSSARLLKGDLLCLRCYDAQCEVCAGCHHVIDPQEERSRIAMGKHYHEGHFRCYHCEKSLDGDAFMERYGNPYCFDDYVKLFIPACFGCQKPLLNIHTNVTLDSWTIDGKELCLECYRCRMCMRKIDPHKKRVVREDSLPVCTKCSEEKNFLKAWKERKKHYGKIPMQEHYLYK